MPNSNPIPSQVLVDKEITGINSVLQNQQVAANEDIAGLTTNGKGIGTISAVVEGPITAQDSQGNTRTLDKNDTVYEHDIIVTVARSYVKITLLDGTVLQLGPLSRASLDKYSYDSNKVGGEFEASIFTGFFRYLSGKISGDHHQGQHTVITTPSANIGIRGSKIDAQIDGDGATNVLHLEGLISVHSRHYLGEEIVVFERGTTIFIPNNNTSPTLNQATEPQIQDYENKWKTLNFDLPGQPVEEKPAFELDLLKLPPDGTEYSQPADSVGGRNPFSPAVESPTTDLQFQVAVVELNKVQDFPRVSYFENPNPIQLSQESQESQESQGSQGITPLEGVLSLESQEVPTRPEFPTPVEETLPPVTTPVTPPTPPSDIPTNTVTETSFTVAEDETQSLTVNGVFSAITVAPVHGQVSVAPAETGVGNDSNLIYIPAPNFNGQDSFTYQLQNGNSVHVNVTINAVNDVPIVQDDNLTVAEDQVLTLSPQDLLRNDSDADVGDTLSVVSWSPRHVLDSFLGEIIFTPPPNFNGEAHFNYTVQDRQGAQATGQVTVEVTAVNDAPVAHDDLFTFEQSPEWRITAADLLANDSDVDSNELTVTQVLNALGGEVRLVGNEIIFTPTIDGINSGLQNQSQFDYVVSDGQGGTDTGRVVLTSPTPLINNPPSAQTDVVRVDLINQPPIAKDDTITTHTLDAILITPHQLLGNDSDPEGDPLTIQSVGNNVNGNLSTDSNGNFIFTPTANLATANTGSFTYQVTDSGEENINVATATVTIQFDNQPPTANNKTQTVIASDTITINTAELLNNYTSDPDNDPRTLTQVNNSVNGNVKIDNGGNLVFTPDDNFFTDKTGHFNYEITDGQGHTAQATLTLLLNQPPVAMNDVIDYPDFKGITPLEGVLSLETLNLTTSQLLANDSDPEGDPLSVVKVNNGDNGTVTLDTLGNIVFTPTPTLLEQGQGTFSYDLADNFGNTATATVTLIVNRPPLAVTDSFDLGRANSITLTPSQLLANDNDPDNDPLTLTLVTDRNKNGAVTTDEQGNLVFTRHPDFAGTGSFIYEISDGHGGTSQAQVNLTGQINRPPTANDLSFDTTKNQPVTLLLQEGRDFVDPDGDPVVLTVDLTNLAGTLELRFDNFSEVVKSAVFTPADNFSGQTAFTYTVTDAYGASDTATVTLTVTNTPPVAVTEPESFYTVVNQTLTISTTNLLSNDLDRDPGDQATLQVVKVDQAMNGNVSIDLPTQTVEFIPTPGFRGEASFAYTIQDRSGAQDSTVVTVIVTPQFQPNADTFTTPQNTSLSLTPAELFSNDVIVNSNDILTLTAVGNATSGTVTQDPALATITFTPEANFVGAASFAYMATDNHGNIGQATVNVNVKALAAVADSVTTPINTPLTIATSQLLENDHGDNLSVTTVNNPTFGEVQLNGTQIVFTPATDYQGLASFDYTVTDTEGDSATTTVTVKVKALAAEADTVTTPANTPLTVATSELLKNDVGDNLTLTAVNNPTHGEVQLNGTQIVFTPAKDYQGTASFDYTVTDSAGDPATTTVTVTVTNQNQPPIINLPNSEPPLIYTVGDPALAIDSQGFVTDVDSPNFDQGQLQVTLINRQSGDLLEIQTGGALTVSAPTGGSIAVNGTTIGTFFTAFATGGLAISLNDQATPETTSILLENITYHQQSDLPNRQDLGKLSVELTLTDGDGGSSATVSRDIQIKMDGKPNAADDAFDRPFNAPVTIALSDLLANDRDPNPADVPTVTEVSADNPNVQVNLVNNEVQLFIDALTSNQFDAATFNYSITDGNGGFDTATVTITPTNVIMGTTGNDTLRGTPGNDIIVGQEGNDTFALTQGADILLGGGGADIFLFDPTHAIGVDLNGQVGRDTLKLTGEGNLNLDLIMNNQLSATQQFNLQGIEVIDLTASAGSGGNKLRLGLQDVLDLSDNGSLTVEGDVSSLVNSSRQGWTDQGLDASGLYHRYTGGGAELLVSNEITFQLIS